MIILGIETSCDETSVSVLKDGSILSNIVYTQLEHLEYGGVVPEIASRDHIRKLPYVFDSAIFQAGIKLNEIDGIAVTYGPGLVGSLLTGLSYAKGLSFALGVPLIPVNHIEAHLLSPFIQKKFPEDKFLALVVSGGHTELYMVNGIGHYELLGATLDDACGEAFDKVAKLIGIGYPGGPAIEKWAKKAEKSDFLFPVPDPPGLDFSYSGLKTAVLYAYRKLSVVERVEKIPEISLAFMRAAIEGLMKKLIRARNETGIDTIAISGGVSANTYLQKRVKEEFKKVYFPPKGFTSDNAGMIAFTGYLRFSGVPGGLYVRADPNAELWKT